MDTILEQIPAAIAIVLIVLKMIMDYFGIVGPKHKKNDDGHASEKIILLKINEKINTIVKQVDDLHQWHDKDDTDGVKIWYVRASLSEAIYKMTDAIDNQTKVMKSVVARLESLDKDAKQLKAD